MAVTQRIDELKSEALSAVAAADSTAELEGVRVRYLGRSAEITDIKKSIGSLPPDDRKEVGRAANLASREIEEALEAQRAKFALDEREARLRAEAVDVTLPGLPFPRGHLHPSERVIDDVVDFFVGLGYRVAEGPEVETDYYNFTALNQPENHPARSMHDTFYLADGDHLLRTHTSPIQIRYMEQRRPPIKIIAPGRVYRKDSDATHSPMFHQIEGLWVDERITFADLKGVLIEFLRKFFERADLRVRFRPSFFPFTEPSAEIDMSFGDGWLEMGGCGMVHPAVLRNVRIDSERWRGFAFGLGPDRLTMLRYGVNDLRLFFENDLRFLRQFN